MSGSDEVRSSRLEAMRYRREEDGAVRDEFAGIQLLPSRSREFDERELPEGCDAPRVRVEVNQRGDQLTLRVRTPRDSWTIEIARGHSRITSQGNYRSHIPGWAAGLLERMDVDPTMDWRELTA